ncbi:MAG: tetratricopeptide repeat protein [Bacteroidota bacterium]
MIKKLFFLIIITLLFNSFAFSQSDASIDSLKKLLTQVDDSIKVDVLTKLCWKLRNSEPENAIKFGKEAIVLADEVNYKLGIVKAYSFTGVAYRNTGNYSEALDFYFKGLELARKYNILEQQGYAYINLGNLYLYQKNHIEAIINLKNALGIANSISNNEMISYCYLNLGRAQFLNGNLELAKEHFLRSLEIRKMMSDTGKIAVSFKYLADVYAAENNFEQAIGYYNKSLEGIIKSNDLDLLADIYNKTANLYLNQGKHVQSKTDAEKSLAISQKIGSKLRIRDAYQTLADIHLAMANYQRAASDLGMVIQYNDSLFNQQLSEKILNIQYSMEQERKQNQINLLNAEKESQRAFIIVLGIALLLGVSSLIISFRLNLLRKKANKQLERQKNDILLKNEELNNQNEEIQTIADSLTEANMEISSQKEEIEKSHKQITSSINYARRIQTAILPDNDSLSTLFPEHLVFFRAKDIVSGDFYWVKKIRNYIVVAVADCTGHGVPGAFLSMLGITLLNEIVRRDDLSKASTVLDILRNQIKSALNQTGKHYENKDGMDLALCAIDTDTMKMHYAGANNPVYILRKNVQESNLKLAENEKIKFYLPDNNKDYSLIEIKPDRQPIGSHVKEHPFTNIEFSLQKNDSIFLFSDGYYDQFSGETGKKFNNVRFRKLLISMADKKMTEQQEILDNIFTKWKKNKEQIDDVMVLGVKV